MYEVKDGEVKKPTQRRNSMEDLKEYFFGKADKKHIIKSKIIFDKLNYKTNIVQNGLFYTLSFHLSSQREFDECIQKYRKEIHIRVRRKTWINKKHPDRLDIFKKWKKDNPEIYKEMHRLHEIKRRTNPLKQRYIKQQQKEYRQTHSKEIYKRTKEYKQKNTYSIRFHETVAPRVRLLERITYNYKTGSVYIDSYFEGNRGKIYYLGDKPLCQNHK